MLNTVMCQRNLRLQNAVFHRNLDSSSTKYGNVSEQFRNKNAVCHRNLQRYNTQYCNVSEEFRITARSFSQEFGEL
jgi:hypothetical protein